MAQCFQLFGSVDIALIAPKLFLKEVRDMEAVSRLEGEVLENDKGHVLMENSQDSTPSEDHQLLSSSHVPSIYLLTYSQADVFVVPTREEFARAVLDSFKNADPCSHCEVVQWVCRQELHRDGGIHYHMAVKLRARRGWLKVRNYMDDKLSIKVNFSNHHQKLLFCLAIHYEGRFFVPSITEPSRFSKLFSEQTFVPGKSIMH